MVTAVVRSMWARGSNVHNAHFFGASPALMGMCAPVCGDQRYVRLRCHLGNAPIWRPMRRIYVFPHMFETVVTHAVFIVSEANSIFSGSGHRWFWEASNCIFFLFLFGFLEIFIPFFAFLFLFLNAWMFFKFENLLQIHDLFLNLASFKFLDFFTFCEPFSLKIVNFFQVR